MKKLFQLTGAFLVGSLLVFASAGRGFAACGDDIEGARVPCRCGDVMVSDTRLLPGDPVVGNRCATDGLIVRAKRGAESIRLDLNGLSILGSGHGTGVRVIDGGKLGATIVGGDGAQRAEIVGFGTGFRARGQRSVRELRNVSFTANARDGAVLRGAATDVVGVQAERNGGDGLHIGGRQPKIDNVETQQNGGSGLRVTSPGAHVGTAVSAGNSGEQMRINKHAVSAEESSR